MPGSSSALSGAAALSPTLANEPARQAAPARLAAALRELPAELGSCFLVLSFFGAWCQAPKTKFPASG